MTGQWIGTISGTNSGLAIFDVDGDRPSVALLQVADSVQSFSAQANIGTDGASVTGDLHSFFAGPLAAGVRLPTRGKFTGVINGDSLSGRWETDVATQGGFELERCDVPRSQPADHSMTWSEFREWAFEQRQTPSLLFRGQKDSTRPLTTTFHRTGRRSLSRYGLEDVPNLLRGVEAELDATFDLANPADFGRLVGLAQHHGYPTPLSDWTESPFVAAFFAFSRLSKLSVDPERRVRVFAFDTKNWPHGKVQSIGDIGPRFAPLALRLAHNRRAIPQQSIHMFSNVVDIERFIGHIEREKRAKFLQRVDISVTERPSAMADLYAMGVTAAALFPGLDGLCRTLAERAF